MDWNGDGMDDIIVGTRLGGVRYFRRLVPDGVQLTQEDSLTVNARPLDMGHNSAPCVTDWNGDGLPDLVVGRVEGIPGGLFLFLNTGSPGAPAFSAWDDTLQCGFSYIQIYYSYPVVHDVDMDGLEDLVSGSGDGLISYFRNTGSPGAPVFDQYDYMRYEDGHVIRIIGYVRPTMTDWNEDGIPDLMIGDPEGFVSWFPGLPPQSAGGAATPSGLSLDASGNPVRSAAVLTVSLDVSATVRIGVWDLEGRMVAEVCPGTLQPGSTDVPLDLSGLPGGVYAVRCTADGESASLLLTHL